ncbi:EAL domain-containing protein [Absiella sp. AM54-8XD]|nr:EAL domain-containing protein [Absiella sp. AM54-8XD]
MLNYEDIEKLKQRLNLLIKKIERYNIRYDLITNISCMLGIYLINDITMDIAQMIDYANTARKSIKDSHESCIAFYNGKLEEKFIREHRLSSIMRQSLKNHEFIVFYQPKVNIYTNQCVGVEALVRWRRQDGNMIYPSEFIPLFEKNHFIIDLDMYVLEQVCIQINTWIKQGKKPLPVSVNISRVDLKNNDIVKQIVEICDTYQINRSLIELEITESAFLENESIAIERSKELKAEGFLLSIDDFGTGFSSLSLLKDLPMDVLKLDHTFFQTQMNKREKIILTNIIRMAKQLDMTIVSEGIETRQHVAFLKTIGCEIAQGFYYARPNEINQLDLWGNFEGEDVS